MCGCGRLSAALADAHDGAQPRGGAHGDDLRGADAAADAAVAVVAALDAAAPVAAPVDP